VDAVSVGYRDWHWTDWIKLAMMIFCLIGIIHLWLSEPIPCDDPGALFRCKGGP
jgi:hypothetical protein